MKCPRAAHTRAHRTLRRPPSLPLHPCRLHHPHHGHLGRQLPHRKNRSPLLRAAHSRLIPRSRRLRLHARHLPHRRAPPRLLRRPESAQAAAHAPRPLHLRLSRLFLHRSKSDVLHGRASLHQRRPLFANSRHGPHLGAHPRRSLPPRKTHARQSPRHGRLVHRRRHPRLWLRRSLPLFAHAHGRSHHPLRLARLRPLRRPRQARGREVRRPHHDHLELSLRRPPHSPHRRQPRRSPRPSRQLAIHSVARLGLPRLQRYLQLHPRLPLLLLAPTLPRRLPTQRLLLSPSRLRHHPRHPLPWRTRLLVRTLRRRPSPLRPLPNRIRPLLLILAVVGAGLARPSGISSQRTLCPSSVPTVLNLFSSLATGRRPLATHSPHSLIFFTLITIRSADGCITIPFTVIRKFSSF